MSQQPDPTIPFDASVVDEEALRALRAVQRSLPMGDGGAGGNLVGGTEAVAAFGMVRGGPSGGIAVGSHEIGSLEWNLAPAPQDESLKPLDLGPPARPAIMLDEGTAVVDLSRSAAPAPFAGPLTNRVRSSSSYAETESDHTSVQVTSPVFGGIPGNPAVVTPPTNPRPDPQDLADILADPPEAIARDVGGLEDSAIHLDLSAALVDRDGSEALTVLILGMPSDAVLSHGTRQADGSWSVSAADLAQLSLTPPEHFSGAITLTLRATAHESQGDSATVETSFRVQVEAVADAPIVTVMDARGSEDAPVSLAGLGGALRDGDGSESLSFVLSGVPADASLNAGVRQPDGTWKLTPDQLAGLTLHPPAHFSGSYTLTLTAVATEGSNGSSARTSASFTVGIDPVADAGTISGASTGAEDTAIVIQPIFAAPDPSETWGEFAQVSGVPAGARLSHGSELSPGVWQVSTADLQAGLVAFHSAEHSDADFTLTVKATLIDAGNGISVSREVTGTHAVTVTAVADAPQVSARDVTGQEDTPIPLNLSAALVDTDGSEILSVSILNVPPGAILSHGAQQADGSWHVPVADLAHLTFTPPHDFSGTVNLTLRATARETWNGNTATTDLPFQVRVTDVSDTPVLTTSDASGPEDTAIALDLSASLTDTDKSEMLSISILGVPAGASLSHGMRQADGSWLLAPSELDELTLRPPQHYSGTINLTVEATSRSSNDLTATTRAPLRVQVEAVADAPAVTVMDARGSEDTPVSLAGLGGALIDRDGSEALSFVLSGVPSNATLSAGTPQPDGTWHLTHAELSGLTLKPPANVSGSYNLTLTAVATEGSNDSEARTSASFTVGFDPVVDTAAISGSGSGLEDTPVTLKPAFDVSDKDDSETWAEFSQVSGVPAGARLSQGSELSPGVWQVSTADLQAGLVLLHPAEHSDADFTLTIKTMLTDTGNGTSVSREVTGSHVVSVMAVADVPQVTAKDVTGQEDTGVPLNLTASLIDTDGSEVLSVVIGNLPGGARLSAGLNNGNGTWTLTRAQLTNLNLIPPENWSGTANLSVLAHARETSNGNIASTHATLKVEVEAVADASQVVARDVMGQEDTPVALDLSAALLDTDGSETMVVSIFGIPEGFTLSAGTSRGDGEWRVPAGDVQGLKLTPLANWNGTLNLTIEAVSTETGSASSATTSKSFTVTLNPVNDAPELTLTTGEHADAGDRQAEAFDTARATDIDSTQLGGAVITLSGAQPGDRLDLEGFTLHSENGRTMIGDTGIELVGGSYAGETGTLTLSGHASPGIYAAVLQSLMLESGAQSGLAAGTRSIAVVLSDSDGAASARQSVDVVIDEAQPVAPEGQGFASNGTEPIQNGAGSDIILLMADEGAEMDHAATASWTEQIDGDQSSDMSHPVTALDQPVADHVQTIDDLQVDASRMNWA